MTCKNKICLDTQTGGRALGLPRQLVAGAMDGQVGTESTGVCGPRTEAGDGSTPRTAQPSLLTLVRLAGDEARRFLFLFFC